MYSPSEEVKKNRTEEEAMFEEKFLANKICLKMVNERKSEHLRQDIKRIRYLDISWEEILIVTIEKKIRCTKETEMCIKKDKIELSLDFPIMLNTRIY